MHNVLSSLAGALVVTTPRPSRLVTAPLPSYLNNAGAVRPISSGCSFFDRALVFWLGGIAWVLAALGYRAGDHSQCEAGPGAAWPSGTYVAMLPDTSHEPVCHSGVVRECQVGSRLGREEVNPTTWMR